MYTLTLHYPNDGVARGAGETVRSSNIPQIGTKLYGGRGYTTWVVAEVSQTLDGGILSDSVHLTLKEEE